MGVKLTFSRLEMNFYSVDFSDLNVFEQCDGPDMGWLRYQVCELVERFAVPGRQTQLSSEISENEHSRARTHEEKILRPDNCRSWESRGEGEGNVRLGPCLLPPICLSAGGMLKFRICWCASDSTITSGWSAKKSIQPFSIATKSTSVKARQDFYRNTNNKQETKSFGPNDNFCPNNQTTILT